MTFRLRVSPRAEADLVAIHDWVEARADLDVADAYLHRVVGKLATLANFPSRGTPRPDLGSGFRTMPFERRLVVIYRVNSDEVEVVRVVSGARDFGRVFT